MEEDTTESPPFCYLAWSNSAKKLKHPLDATVHSAQKSWFHMLAGGSTFRQGVDLYLHGRVIPAFNPGEESTDRITLADRGVPERGLVLCETFWSRHEVRLARRPKHAILDLPSTTPPYDAGLELDERARCRARRTKYDLQSIEQAIKHDRLNVQVVRVADDQSWVDLMVPGPPGSFYEGGEFVLRIAYARYWCVQARMMTPMYHPTIGPQGEVAVIMTEDRDVPHTHSSLPALRSLVRQLSTYAFTDQHAETLHKCFTAHKTAGQAMRRFYEGEWLRGGQERAREVARQWTWHYATPHGQAYHRDGQQCTTVAQIASLISFDSELRREVRMVLLVMRRLHTENETIGELPAELVIEIVKHLASHRTPPPSLRHHSSETCATSLP